MEYYGASASEREVVSTLLGLPLDAMGQDWEFILSDSKLVAPAIKILLAMDDSWGVRAAIACILISSLYEYYRDEEQDHPLREDAISALKKDSTILEAMRIFWLSDGNHYICRILSS
ncbi:hypothetical protein [Pseudomonas chlororaphis]|uniref:hypothetical protein n=1 Tax=Pseudomonas chlororaphis TaxID=587753 RepID=UPI000F55E6D2|nr:hypothetical protein [Pseudomonas chlororaphis]MBP5089501.1 hypothetical protein [Pseudomonas chlororaphis]MBP5139032.1 hypothetical protein [Pseudomonas chlororaphis]